MNMSGIWSGLRSGTLVETDLSLFVIVLPSSL